MLDLVEIGPAVLKKMFKFHQCIFPNFIIISPCTRIWPFIWTTLNLLYSSIFVSTLVSIGRVVLEKSFLLLKLLSLSKTIFWNINKRIQPNLPSRMSILHNSLCLCATSTVTRNIRLQWSSPRTRDTHTGCRTFSYLFLRHSLSRLWFKHPTFRMQSERPNGLRHRHSNQE